MKINILYNSNPEIPLTIPFPKANWSIMHRVTSGDVCDMFFGNWFSPPWPKVVVKYFSTRKHHYWSWRLWDNQGGYFGWKLYGADAPEYKNWMPEAAVYDGSMALCFTIRPFATIKD